MVDSTSAKTCPTPAAFAHSAGHQGGWPPLHPVHRLFAPTQLSAPRVTHGASGSLGRPPADPSLLQPRGTAGRRAGLGGTPWASETERRVGVCRGRAGGQELLKGCLLAGDGQGQVGLSGWGEARL